MNAIGEGCLTSLLASIIDFAILGHTVRISNFPLQIQNPLQIWVWNLFERSQSEKVTQPAPPAPNTVLGIAGATGTIKYFHGRIHNLLENLSGLLRIGNTQNEYSRDLSVQERN